VLLYRRLITRVGHGQIRELRKQYENESLYKKGERKRGREGGSMHFSVGRDLKLKPLMIIFYLLDLVLLQKVPKAIVSLSLLS